MKYIKNYQDFKNDSVNEEFLGSLWNMAKGAFKSFLGGLSNAFKSLKDDFKKELPREELKKKITGILDNLLKSSTDSINKAEDESALNQIMDQFRKEFDEKCIEIDKEIKTVKESKLNESLQDSMIAGRVLLGMIRNKAAEVKMEFDKKFAAAKDLAGKKASRISEIKMIVDDFKKKVTNDQYIDELIKKYKEENKIITVLKNNLILNWGDVEIELKVPEKGETKYGIIKSNSMKLVIPKGKTLLCDITGEAKKGDRVKLENITAEDGKTEFKIGADDFYETGELVKIVLNGKEVDSYKFSEMKPEEQTALQQNLTKLKDTKAERLGDVKKFTDFALTGDDKSVDTIVDMIDDEMKK